MRTYLSTFISGLQNPVSNLLKENIKDVRINSVLDGLIIYETNESHNKIKQLRFFNNTFILIKTFTNLGKNSLDNMLKDISKMKNLTKIISRLLSKDNKSFRIMVSKENQFVSANKNILKKIEKKILSSKRKLKFNLHKPDTEFWFLQRRENIGFFMLRLTKNITNKKLHKGELRPELAHILCYLSEPDKEDIFLDPFSGYGSIPIERAKSFPANIIFATDKKEEYKKYFNEKIKLRKLKIKIILKTLNALNMGFFKNNFITKIVTDPPWGIYEGVDINKFYDSMINEFLRVVKNKGIIVVLTSKKQEFEKIICNHKKDIKLLKKYDILVSGKKAGIYKLKRL